MGSLVEIGHGQKRQPAGIADRDGDSLDEPSVDGGEVGSGILEIIHSREHQTLAYSNQAQSNKKSFHTKNS